MNEDAELRILVPLRLLVFDEGCPVGAIGALVPLAFRFGQKAIALDVIFADRLLPFAIDLRGGFHTERWCKRIGRRRRLREERRRGQKEQHSKWKQSTATK